ncbi:hypothetical protein ONZ51_g10667 [Trametes cubensis]|uniref:Uncharacterized protein n=1 Tax=Trametes cubensis TaxID=1111947 RepID=A0AAD7TK32_9APHY|nr:hypothetical protein ONZ51_g10667 [Trametes cubensis]
MAFATSTFSRLPEELLDEILHEVLTLPRKSFLGWTHCGTYGCKPTSIAADVLRVSKTWARVGQRHLYEGVIIRRKAQAKSLAQTLVASAKGVSNSRTTLAQRIRRLRIDRVQCGDVKVILKLATMVVDFHISLDVPPAPRPLDWLPGFQRMSPRRLYIQGTPQGNKNNERLVKAIEEVVMSSTEQLATWKRLEEVHLHGTDFKCMPRLGEALSSLPALRLVTASAVQPQRWWEEFILLVGGNEHLRAMFVDSVHYWPNHSRNRLEGRVKEITHFRSFYLPTVQAPGPVQKHDSNAFSGDSVSADRLSDSIWRRILSYVMVGYEPDKCNEHDWWLRSGRTFHPRRSQDFLLLSRRFKSIAEPLLHAAPWLKSPTAMEKYVQHLREHPEYGQHNRVLTADSIQIIPWLTPNLRVSHNVLPYILQSGPTTGLIPQPLPSLVWLRLDCGDTNLRGGHGTKGTPSCTRGCLDATFFNGLPNLKYLDMCGCVVGTSRVTPLADALPRVEEVRLGLAGGSGAIESLTTMTLPSLKRLRLDFTNSWKDSGSQAAYAFLLKHGGKLIAAQIYEIHDTARWNDTLLTLCPNLKGLVIGDSVLTMGQFELLRASQPHQHLKIIYFNGAQYATRGYFSANREPWLQFPSVVDFTSLVALEEVRFPKEHTWPDSETSAEKSPWPQIARELNNRFPKIFLADHAGRRWARY